MSTSDNTNTAPVSGRLNGPAKTMQSVTRRVLPTVVYGLIVVALAIAGLERFRSSRDVPGSVGDPRDSATALFGGRPDPISVPANEDSNSAGKALVRAPSSSQGTPAGSPNTSEEYGAIQRQISAVSNELAALRSSVEKLAATQQQMGADIAALKASEENIYQKLLTEDAELTGRPCCAAQTTVKCWQTAIHSTIAIGASLKSLGRSAAAITLANDAAARRFFQRSSTVSSSRVSQFSDHDAKRFGLAQLYVACLDAAFRH